MNIYLRLEAPFEWVRVNGKQVEAFGEVPSLDDYPINKDDEVIGVVPGEWITTHTVELPAKSKKQFNAALPYALEESISEEVENMHFICPNWKVNEPCHVMVVAKDKMDDWQRVCNEHRLPAQQLLPDYALVPLHDAADYSLSLSDGMVFANQANGFGVSIDADFLDVWMMDIPVDSTIAVNEKELTETLIAEHAERDFRHWPFGHKMAHWLEHSSVVSDLDLWSDKYRPSFRRQGSNVYLFPLLLLILSVSAKFAYDGYRYVSLHREIKSIQQESQALFKEAFPDLGVIAVGKEREVMEQAISRLGGADRSRSLQGMLAQTANVLKLQNVTLTDLVYRDSELIVTCLLSDFSQVDRLTRELNGRGSLKATLQSSAADGGNIIASYSLKQV